jgi:solute carrier family 35 protein F5
VRQRRLSPSYPRGSLEVRPLLPRPSSIDGRRPRSIIDASTAAPLPIVALAPAAPLGEPPLTFSETGWLAAQFTLVWFAANWSLNAGLGLTSVASGTTLSSASGA